MDKQKVTRRGGGGQMGHGRVGRNAVRSSAPLYAPARFCQEPFDVQLSLAIDCALVNLESAESAGDRAKWRAHKARLEQHIPIGGAP